MLKILIFIILGTFFVELKSEDLFKKFMSCHNINIARGMEGVVRKTKNFYSNINLNRNDWQIVSGKKGDIKDFPYHANILYCNTKPRIPDKFICEGSIISDNIILSAAHCIMEWTLGIESNKTLRPEYYIIHVGSSVKDNEGQYVTLSEVRAHPDTLNPRSSSGRDLSIMKTSKSLTLNDKVAIIPLATPDISSQLEDMEKSGTECVVAGWGTLSTDGPMPYQIMYIKVPLLSFKLCSMFAKIKGKSINRETHLCTYDVKKHVCNGDSGSGLVCTTDGVRRVWGVVSFGDCEDGPSFYARVDTAFDFLEPFLKENKRTSLSAVFMYNDNLKRLFLTVILFLAVPVLCFH